MRFTFDDIGLDRLLSIRHVDHVASGRVMEKLGFAFERTTTVPVHEQPVSVWELDASGLSGRRRSLIAAAIERTSAASAGSIA